MQQAIKHPEAIKLLRKQAWQMFWLGALAGTAIGGFAIMVGLLIAAGIYV